jgi:uncharacterized membrane protein YsdA (DUF1294 family)
MFYFLSYIVAVNLITFLLFGIDKFFAKKQKRRIPESTLLFCGVTGGGLGGILGVYYFKHKNKKVEFMRRLWVIGALWILGLWGWFTW